MQCTSRLFLAQNAASAGGAHSSQTQRNDVMSLHGQHKDMIHEAPQPCYWPPRERGTLDSRAQPKLAGLWFPGQPKAVCTTATLVVLSCCSRPATELNFWCTQTHIPIACRTNRRRR